MFIADNSLNRVVCWRWTSKTQRKENFLREVRVTPLTRSNLPRIGVSPSELHERSQHFIGADDETLSAAMFRLLVVVENGYDG